MATFSGAAEWGSKSQVGDVFGTLNTWFPSCRPLKGVLCHCRTKCRWQGGDSAAGTFQQLCGEISPRCPALKSLSVSRDR